MILYSPSPHWCSLPPAASLSEVVREGSSRLFLAPRLCLSGEAAEHQTTHAEIDPSLSGLRHPFIIFAKTAVQAQPAERALDHPPSRQHGKSGERHRLDPGRVPAPPTRSFYHLDRPPQRVFDPVHEGAPINHVNPEMAYSGHVLTRPSYQAGRCVRIAQVRLVHEDFEQ